MKRHVIIVLLAISTVVLAMAVTSCPARAEASISYFQATLAPHGSWTFSVQFGEVWRPHHRGWGWHPYHDGHWAYSDLGWCWVSDYPWGAIPYHYGTWVFDLHLGWVWVPGYAWAPSWVVFRTGPDYVGWAPVPVSFVVGLRFDDPHPDGFVFVAVGDFLAPRVGQRAISQRRVRQVIVDTHVANPPRVEAGLVVHHGPDLDWIERATRQTVQRRRIEEVGKATPEPPIVRERVRVERDRRIRGVRAAEPRRERAAPPPKPAKPPRANRPKPGKP